MTQSVGSLHTISLATMTTLRPGALMPWLGMVRRHAWIMMSLPPDSTVTPGAPAWLVSVVTLTSQPMSVLPRLMK